MVIRAARYLGVPPWVVWEQPAFWTELALAAENAENAAGVGQIAGLG